MKKKREKNKKLIFIEFILFGSALKSFAINGPEERENYYYSLFKKNNFEILKIGSKNLRSLFKNKLI